MTRLIRGCTFDRLLTTLLFLAIVLACGLTPMQTDTWWQLRAGRDMWHSGRVLLTDVYSHTAYGAFWLNHEWFAEIAYYAAYRVGGFPLVTLFAAALIASGWAITWRLTRGPVRTAFLLCAFALVPAATWWEPRPHAFSLLFVPATAALIANGRLLWLPVIFLVWANAHGGVLLGLALAGIGLSAQVLREPRLWRRAITTLAACAAATTATPLGLGFWIEIPKSLARIRMYPLDEWQPPQLTDPAMITYWLLAAAFVAGMVRHRDRLLRLSAAEAPVVAYALALLPLSLLAIRNVGPFLMLAVPVLTALIEDERGAPASAPATERGVANLLVIASATVLVTATLTWAYVQRIPKLRWQPVPEQALAALETCPDNLYNRYDEGGSLIWFAPARRVFMDGRQDPFPPHLVLEHIRVETGEAGHEAVFARHGIRCAYLPVISPTARRLESSGWTTLYRDGDWVVLRIPAEGGP